MDRTSKDESLQPALSVRAIDLQPQKNCGPAPLFGAVVLRAKGLVTFLVQEEGLPYRLYVEIQVVGFKEIDQKSSQGPDGLEVTLPLVIKSIKENGVSPM